MIKSLNRMFVGCLILAVFTAIAQPSPLAGSLVIKGKINGVLKGNASLTTEVFGDKQTFEAPIVQGKFEVKVNQPSPTLYSLVVNEDPSGRLLMFADNGTVNVEINKGDLYNAKVTGSNSHRDFVDYNTLVANYDNILGAIQQHWNELEEKGQLMPKVDSLQQIFRRTEQEKTGAIATWITKHNSSFVSPLIMILNYANDGEPVAMRNMYDGFNENIKQSYYANYLNGIISRKEGLNIGKIAPEFSQADPNGKPISLESFRGKYVLIDFWASWCGPCRQENPNVVRTYEKYKNKNFEILGVSLDNDKSKWLKAIADDELTWAQVSDLKYWRNAVAVQYGVQSIPANFLLDKEGRIIAKGLRGPALEYTLEKLLSQNN